MGCISSRCTRSRKVNTASGIGIPRPPNEFSEPANTPAGGMGARQESSDSSSRREHTIATAPPPTSSICEVCWKGPFSAQLGIFHEQIEQSVSDEGQLVATGGYAYSTSIAKLKSRAAAGCQWCRLVLAAHTCDYREYGEKSAVGIAGDKHDVGSVVDSAGVPLVHLRVRVGILHPDSYLEQPGDTALKGLQELAVLIDELPHFVGCVYAAAEDPAGAHIVARPRILDVGSPRSLALAKECIEECVRGHERCGVRPPTSPAAFLPTRLVDCADPDRPRLVITKGTRGEYAALSYVWGEAQPHETTESKVSAYANLIDPATFPQTIRDAIFVTHALGLRYIWIDSLCIIQDSIEDKRHEIGRMRHVYRDAYLTIIASSAQRVSEGFLQDRPPIPNAERLHADGRVLVPDLTLPFICPHTAGETADRTPKLGTIHILPLHMHCSNPRPKALMEYEPTGEPISSRAWTMQEYMMSRRSLVFASHTVQFHCQTTIMNVGKAYQRVRASAEKRLPPALLSEGPPPVERFSKDWWDVHLSWMMIVVDYTKRSLTKSSDKLIACGGIAEECHRALRTDYLAGLWRDVLHFDLLWSKRGGLALLPRPAEYRAPSWSWAAVEGPVSCGLHELFPGPWSSIAEVVRCEVTLEADALPFGGVTGGFLVLRTPLMACSWNTGEPNYLCRVLPSTKSEDSAEAQGPEEGETARIGMGYLDSVDDAGIQRVWAAPIHWRPTYMAGIIVCLVSGHHSSGTELKSYRRVGYFDTGNIGVGGSMD